MTDEDKTVGGRTRANWEPLFRDWMGLTPDLVALLDAAFSSDAHSRGIREGLERAAMIAESIVGWGGVGQEIAKRIRRAEASKLDGEEQPYTLTKAVAEAALDVTRPFREARAAARQPEPPAEERRDAHAFVVGPVPDYCHFTAGGGRCNQSRAWHEPAEERKLLGHTFDQVGDLGYATELDICQRPIRHPAGDQVCGQPRSAHEQEG